MSEQFDPNVYDDETGEFIGTYYDTDDGGAVLVDESGVIVRAVDAQAQPVDVSEYEFAADDAGVPSLSAEQELRLAQLEQRMTQSQPQPWLQPQRSQEQQLADLMLQADDIGRMRGHALTNAEKRALAERALEVSAVTGEGFDLMAAANDLEDQGRSPFIDTSTTAGKAQWAGERARDATDGSDPGTGRLPPTSPIDSTESAARVARAVNSLHGYGTDDEGNTFDTMEGNDGAA